MGLAQARLFQADLIPPDEWTHVFVECKKRKEFNFRQLAEINGSKLFTEWLNQVYQDYDESKQDYVSFRFLVFAEKHSGIFICYKPNDTLTESDLIISGVNYITYYAKIKTFVGAERPIKFVIHELTTEWLQKNKTNMQCHKPVVTQ